MQFPQAATAVQSRNTDNNRLELRAGAIEAVPVDATAPRFAPGEEVVEPGPPLVAPPVADVPDEEDVVAVLPLPPEPEVEVLAFTWYEIADALSAGSSTMLVARFEPVASQHGHHLS